MTAPASRVLVVDDTPAIHLDFSKILLRQVSTSELDAWEAAAFGEAANASNQRLVPYELDSAYQGAEALERVRASARDNDPYAMAFVDMRMPPGWDGLETIERLWAVDPGLQIVICSAYSDYDWSELLQRLGQPDNLLIIKKPFEPVEVLQCANALVRKWHAERALRQHLASLEDAVQARTQSLEAVNRQLLEQMRLREAVEVELALAQKLESVGRLASGIAHEINTPIQYITDSIHFLGSAFADLLGALEAQRPEGPLTADLQFLKDEVPAAISRTIEGTERVATIVRAMKEFAHPDGAEQVPANINRALETTLLIARNEYKYVAIAELVAGEIPEVSCNIGELSQVFLNLIVNSAHALADLGRTAETGRIFIRTTVAEDSVEIEFEDNGCGIPAQIINKIYDPFFTTKEVGRGSGQGLAIARSIVVDKHAGQIRVSSKPGEGTSFIVRLPIGGQPTVTP